MRHLVIAPHPDDEVLGCGGTIAARVEAGEPVHVIAVVTSDSPQHSREGFTPAATRVRELEEVGRFLGFQHELWEDDESLHERLDTVAQRTLIDRFEQALNHHRPDVVYLPSREDFDQDHRAVFDAAHTALRPHPPAVRHFVPRVLVYEQPKIAWSRRPFRPQAFQDISPWMDRKLEALALHASQLRAVPNTRSPENVRALAHLRGAQIGVQYAEAFEVLREVLR